VPPDHPLRDPARVKAAEEAKLLPSRRGRKPRAESSAAEVVPAEQGALQERAERVPAFIHDHISVRERERCRLLDLILFLRSAAHCTTARGPGARLSAQAATRRAAVGSHRRAHHAALRCTARA